MGVCMGGALLLLIGQPEEGLLNISPPRGVPFVNRSVQRGGTCSDLHKGTPEAELERGRPRF